MDFKPPLVVFNKRRLFYIQIYKVGGINLLDNIIKVLTHYGGLFVTGTGYTLLLSFLTVLGGIIFGSLLAIMKRTKTPLAFFASAYIEVIRGTPILLQLYFFYFFLPDILRLDLSKFTCILIALIVNSSAYVSEIIRAGLQAVDKGQNEAARSLGLSATQTMIKIIMPQAVKNILPALCNEFIMVIKETSLASTFFVGELMTQFKTVQTALYLPMEPLIIVGVIYFFLTFTLSKIVAAYERRLAVSD